MSVKSKPYYWVVCDWPGCGASAQDDSDYAAWADSGTAEQEAHDGDWRHSDDGLHYCPEHPVEWDSDHEDGEPYPDSAFLLMSNEHGHVTLTNGARA